jgi:uncharacterized repeat protein (TIGR03803 family)
LLAGVLIFAIHRGTASKLAYSKAVASLPQCKKGGSMSKLTWWKTGCALSLLCAATAIGAPGQTFTTLVTFDGTNGAQPVGSLVQGADGNLYGTTTNGGAYSVCSYGSACGTVFKVTPEGGLTTLYSFDATDGSQPVAGLVLGTDGNLYGTTQWGGLFGWGTVFNITTDGDLSTLYNFRGGVGYGGLPAAPLVQAGDGDFYGTTAVGGSKEGCSAGCGTVFKITLEGALTTLFSFGSADDGDYPGSGLLQGLDGNFYGTTQRYAGTIFEITPEGALTTLYDFPAAFTDPNGLIQTASGELYGTTRLGGADEAGMIYKLSPTGGTPTKLFSFDCTDGCDPGALIQATDGNFYGATYAGGSPYGGTIFKLTPDGTFTTLHYFCSQPNCADGESPLGPLVQATDGNLYGATYYGPYGPGTCAEGAGCGTVFKLDVGLGPFVKTVPPSGSVGTTVMILGTNLTGATNVKFNGAPATFTVVSSSEITTTVPAGASTGEVDVETPGGKLSSNIEFTIAP